MAILYIKAARSSARRRLAIAVAALAVGVALGAILAHTPTREPQNRTYATAGKPITATPGCCAATPSPVPLQPPPAAVLATSPAPAELYREARRYADCLALQEPERQAQALSDGTDERYEIDPSGAFAAALARADQEQHMACRLIGPHEFRQIDALMRDAAARGDADARFFLLDRQVADALSAALVRREQGQSDAGDATSPGMQAEVEQMAIAGYRPAMTLTAQLLMSGLLAAADPRRSAAWQLVAMQLDYPQPVTDDQLRDAGLLDDLTAEEGQALRREAAALHGRCCGAVEVDAGSGR
jgi:hypothetical protein